MKKFVAVLDRLDTRMLVLAAVMLSCIGYAGFKMVTAWTGDSSTPAYRNAPAKAFAPPAAETLVDTAYMNVKRLPDDDYVAVTDIARELLPAAATLTLDPEQLTPLGMSSREAKATVAGLTGQEAALSGRSYGLPDTLAVTPADGNTAAVSAAVEYSAQEATGAAPVSANVNFSFARADEQWELTALTLTVDNAPVLGDEISP